MSTIHIMESNLFYSKSTGLKNFLGALLCNQDSENKFKQIFLELWVAILSGSQSEITLEILSDYNVIYYVLLSSKNLCCSYLTLLL